MVLKRNLPSSVSSRLNPWEEATAPRSPATPDLDEGFRPKRQPGTDRGMMQTLEYPLPDTEISDPTLTWPNGAEREPRNLLEAVQAAARRKGLLPQAPEPEFDYPMLGRTMKTLTTILGRHPKAGDLIPANHVDAYLKALSADQFDKRDDQDFFKHVQGAYKQAHPKTEYDATGRMVDSPPIAIAFNPFGDQVPRAQPQNAGLGTGMPGIMKASFPAGDLMPVRETAPIKGPEISSDDRRSTRSDSAFQSSSKPEEIQIAQAPAQAQPIQPTQQKQYKPLPQHGLNANGDPVSNLEEPDWHNWQDTLDRNGIVGEEREIFEYIYAIEGGMKVPQNKGPTRAGISIQGLNDQLANPKVRATLLSQGFKPGMKPAELTPDQQVIFYRTYLNSAMAAAVKRHNLSGSALLAQIPDKASRIAVAESLWRVGSGEGTEMIQSAANAASKAMGGGTLIRDIDGNYGSETHGALLQLLADPKAAKAFVNDIADRWVSKYAGSQGDLRRADLIRSHH